MNLPQITFHSKSEVPFTPRLFPHRTPATSLLDLREDGIVVIVVVVVIPTPIMIMIIIIITGENGNETIIVITIFITPTTATAALLAPAIEVDSLVADGRAAGC